MAAATKLIGHRSEANGHVTWRGLVGAALTAVGIAVAASIAIWQAHASQPHAGSVRQAEFSRAVDGLHRRIDRHGRTMEKRLDRIEQKLDR